MVSQERTKAIVEAAERLADSPSEHELLHVCDECRERLFALRSALSLPAPQWARTPPSEPGRYHMRRHLDNNRGTVYYIVNVFPDLGMVDFAWGDTSVPFAELVNDEWFPVRIEEPPA